VLLAVEFTPDAVPFVTAAVELRKIALTTLDDVMALHVTMALRSHTPTGTDDIV
jgi:hypothetical protein